MPDPFFPFFILTLPLIEHIVSASAFRPFRVGCRTVFAIDIRSSAKVPLRIVKKTTGAKRPILYADERSMMNNKPIRSRHCPTGVPIVLSLAFIFITTLAVRPQTNPQTAIGDAAAEYGLGRSNPKTPQPIVTGAPRTEGWRQSFERGWVYWHPRFGTRVVRGKIFETWAAQRAEQGPMGFPTGSETNCLAPDGDDLYQSFEGGTIHWSAAANVATAYPAGSGFGVGGRCFEPAQGRFRVTINGFTCNRQTVDLPSLYPDGMDDELWVESKSFTVQLAPGGPTMSAPFAARTFFYGDTAGGNFGQRTQAGSGRRLGANGGFRAGDSYPESPQKHSTGSVANGLPLAVWEGFLIRRQNAVVILPTIWETDSNTQPIYAPWSNMRFSYETGVAVGRLIQSYDGSDQDAAKNSIRHDVDSQVTASLWFMSHPVDRPIGMREYAAGGYRFEPESLILTYDEAVRMAKLSGTKNREAFPVTYTEVDWLGGNYTVYVQIEMLP